MREGTGLRERLVARASVVTGSEGWSRVTMARLADDVGVSRQTVYNEVGGKPALGEAVVMREVGLFLTQVEDDLLAEPDPVEAVRRAAYGVLVHAAEDPLLRAILSTSHGSRSELLPLLTTRSAALLEAAAATIRPHLARLAPELPAERLDPCVDMVVRLVLSHVMQPAGTPSGTADAIAGTVRAVLEAP